MCFRPNTACWVPQHILSSRSRVQLHYNVRLCVREQPKVPPRGQARIQPGFRLSLLEIPTLFCSGNDADNHERLPEIGPGIVCTVLPHSIALVSANRNKAHRNTLPQPDCLTVTCYELLRRYARDGAVVELRGISLFDNNVARGSVVFVVDSTLKTYQVRDIN